MAISLRWMVTDFIALQQQDKLTDEKIVRTVPRKAEFKGVRSSCEM